jgi:2-dehydropantoate 2-reductase
LGAGGVGGTLGAILAAAGEDVVMIVRPGTKAHYPNQLSLQSHLGTAAGPARVVETLAEPADVLWVTVKATQLADSLESIPASSTVGAVVPLLNGIDHVEVLRSRFGHERVMPATIAGEMERAAPGKYVHPSPFMRLRLSSDASPFLDEAVKTFAGFGIECKYIDNEQTLLWGKLVFLAPFALSTTAANGNFGKVLSDPIRRKLMEDCIRETAEAGRANGAELDAEATIKMLSGSPGEMRSSMQKDVDANRPPELDAIAGPILRTAQIHGFHANATQQLVAEVKRRIA